MCRRFFVRWSTFALAPSRSVRARHLGNGQQAISFTRAPIPALHGPASTHAHVSSRFRFWFPYSVRSKRALLRRSEPCKGRDTKEQVRWAFSPDGRWLASGAHDGAMQLWDRRVGAVVRTLGRHARPVRSLVFSAGGRTLITAAMTVLAVEADRLLRGRQFD